MLKILEQPLDNFGDVLRRVGYVPASRILLHPLPGTATEKDLLSLLDGDNKRICELVDGVLVEKPMGTEEAYLALRIGQLINNYLDEHDYGLAYGADAPFRLRERLVRLPDISVVSWKRIGKRKVPRKPVLDVAPELAIEVISKSNTRKEIALKLHDYFQAGVLLVWIVHPRKRSVIVHTSETEAVTLDKAAVLDGGDVLPGFQLPLARLFAKLEQ